MKLISTVSEMQAHSAAARNAGRKVALIPTMGFLHEGHLQLIDAAKKHATELVLSIFVNPTQFGPGEDLATYPRNIERDTDLARRRGVSCLFLPTAEEMYPTGEQTRLQVPGFAQGLCGAFRPGHFEGVATVVTKLFMAVQPDYAVFGEKDFQQLRVIQRMVEDLFFEIKIVPVPTLREDDGLAMSSRNSYLNSVERASAVRISQALFQAEELVQKGMRDVAQLKKKLESFLKKDPLLSVQYLEVVAADTLQNLTSIDREARLVLAVFVNGKRLIDNIALHA